jgi:hypothetical protein
MQNRLDFIGHGGPGSCMTPHQTADLCQVGRTTDLPETAERRRSSEFPIADLTTSTTNDPTTNKQRVSL